PCPFVALSHVFAEQCTFVAQSRASTVDGYVVVISSRRTILFCFTYRCSFRKQKDVRLSVWFCDYHVACVSLFSCNAPPCVERWMAVRHTFASRRSRLGSRLSVAHA